jgi:hypothetical protein
VPIRFVQERRGDSVVRETWFEVPLGDWIAAWRLLPHGGRTVFGELRVYPNEARHRPGRWSAERLGDEAKVPQGGITADTLRQVAEPDVHRRRAHEEIAQFGERLLRRWPGYDAFGPAGVLGRHGIRAEDFEAGRLRLDDLFYAELAAAYADAVEAGNTRPIDTLAEEIGRSRNYVRDVIREARARGYLTKTASGRAGGRLTIKARKLLRQRDEEG